MTVFRKVSGRCSMVQSTSISRCSEDPTLRQNNYDADLESSQDVVHTLCFKQPEKTKRKSLIHVVSRPQATESMDH